jgi:hypothetical protein
VASEKEIKEIESSLTIPEADEEEEEDTAVGSKSGIESQAGQETQKRGKDDDDANEVKKGLEKLKIDEEKKENITL